MATLNNRYTINGLVDTSQTALENMTAVTNSCNTWLSYDALVGKWSVVINQAGTSQFSFDDSNIIGPVNLTTTDLGGFYNSVEVRFHNLELRDREDYALLETPADQRLPNEPDNRLIINAPLVNNQIQAQLLGLIELKQSRLDKVIEFVTDFSYINIEAGTIISVTNSVYGWTNKLFRVLTMTEQQTADSIQIAITAQEYDVNIYSEDDLYLYLRETEDGLIELDPLVDVSPVTVNTAVVDGSGNSLLGVLSASALISLIKGLMEDNASGNGTIFGQVFDVFDQQTGVNLVEAQNAAMYWNQAGSITNTTGPFTNQTFTIGNAPIWTNADLIYTVATFNFISTGTQVSDFHSVQMKIYKNNVLVGTQENSATVTSQFQDMTLSYVLLGTDWAVNDLLKIEFVVSTTVAAGVNIDYFVFQPYTSSYTP